MTALTVLSPVVSPALLVREMVVGDADGFAGYMLQTRYQRYLATRYSSDSAINAFVSRAVGRQGGSTRTRYDVAAECRLTGNLRGDGFIIFHERATAELGWGIDPTLWGRGLGTELAKVLIAVAIEHLGAETVWCKVMGPNLASRRVARNAGLKHDRIVSGFGSNASASVHIFTLASEDYYEQPY